MRNIPISRPRNHSRKWQGQQGRNALLPLALQQHSCPANVSRIPLTHPSISVFFFICSPREFVDCVAHIRLLSWVLLGSLTYTAQVGNVQGQTSSQPIPQEASCQIADHIQVVIAGFGEQPKASIIHMSSLFHTFILCQVNGVVRWRWGL